MLVSDGIAWDISQAYSFTNGARIFDGIDKKTCGLALNLFLSSVATFYVAPS
jgi:hypothetical protein